MWLLDMDLILVPLNGHVCKDPNKLVKANDFFFNGLHLAGNTSNPAGSQVITANVAQIPGLNVLLVLQKGDVLVFLVGLVHFQHNVGNGNAVAIAAFSSQNPGVTSIANEVFGSNAGCLC
ncbi:hypothetical protein ACLB2K_023587 [Fragaria x ananassa]